MHCKEMFVIESSLGESATSKSMAKVDFRTNGRGLLHLSRDWQRTAEQVRNVYWLRLVGSDDQSFEESVDGRVQTEHSGRLSKLTQTVLQV